MRPLLERFQGANRRRYGPYPYLQPSRIPQSTNI
jgi:hypothetical protein